MKTAANPRRIAKPRMMSDLRCPTTTPPGIEVYKEASL